MLKSTNEKRFYLQLSEHIWFSRAVVSCQKLVRFRPSRANREATFDGSHYNSNETLTCAVCFIALPSESVSKLSLARYIFSLFAFRQQQIAVKPEKEKDEDEEKSSPSLSEALLFLSRFTQVILIKDKPLMMRVPVISLVKAGYTTWTVPPDFHLIISWLATPKKEQLDFELASKFSEHLFSLKLTENTANGRKKICSCDRAVVCQKESEALRLLEIKPNPQSFQLLKTKTLSTQQMTVVETKDFCSTLRQRV